MKRGEVISQGGKNFRKDLEKIDEEIDKCFEEDYRRISQPIYAFITFRTTYGYGLARQKLFSKFNFINIEYPNPKH